MNLFIFNVPIRSGSKWPKWSKWPKMPKWKWTYIVREILLKLEKCLEFYIFKKCINGLEWAQLYDNCELGFLMEKNNDPFLMDSNKMEPKPWICRIFSALIFSMIQT
jgi:hypothetical protein